MRFLNTLLGSLHPEEMGTVAAREHLLWGPAGWEADPSAWFKVTKGFERAFNELLDFKLLGGQTFIDCSGIGWGRDVDFHVKIAAVTGMHVVASTGFWSGSGTPPHFRGWDAQAFEKLFLHELTEGMGRTKYKAGLISVGNDGAEPSPLEVEIYRGAARAARATGAAVFTHGVEAARWQLGLFREEGLDLSRVIVGDCDRVVDFERDSWLARQGACVAYDNTGLEEWSRLPHAMPDSRRAEMVARMFAAGLGEQVFIASGSRIVTLGHGEPYLGNIGNVLRYFVPRLAAAGLSPEDIQRLLSGTPKRVLPMGAA